MHDRDAYLRLHTGRSATCRRSRIDVTCSQQRTLNWIQRQRTSGRSVTCDGECGWAVWLRVIVCGTVRGESILMRVWALRAFQLHKCPDKMPPTLVSAAEHIYTVAHGQPCRLPDKTATARRVARLVAVGGVHGTEVLAGGGVCDDEDIRALNKQLLCVPLRAHSDEQESACADSSNASTPLPLEPPSSHTEHGTYT
jgi:hypothetical protein